MPSSSKNTVTAWSILVSLVIVWGSSFFLIKKSLEVFAPVQVGSLRIIIATFSLLPFVYKKIGGIKKKQWMVLALAGLFGNGLPAYFFAIAQQGIDSSVAGTLNSLTTLFTLIIGMSFFRLKAKWFNMLGVFIGLIGAIGLIYISGEGNFTFNMHYAIFIILATICYAINVNVIKTYLSDMKPLLITAFALFSIVVPVLVILFGFTDFTSRMHEARAWEGIGYLAILAIVGTALALIFFNRLIQMTSSIFAASVTYMIPIVAIIWGILDGESFNIFYLLWMGLILLGVFLVNKKGNNTLEKA